MRHATSEYASAPGAKSLDATIEKFSKQHPAHQKILSAFHPLFTRTMELRSAFAGRDIPLQSLDVTRMGHGVPVLADVSLEFLAPWIEQSCEAIAPLLLELAPDGDELAAIFTAQQQGVLNIADCSAYYIEQDTQSLTAAAEEAGVNPALLGFVLSRVLAAPVGALAEKVQAMPGERVWKQGFCPICGGFPSVATLARPAPTDLDSLVGGGGEKYLHCSLCANEWRYRRDACPACENSDPGTREMVFVEDNKHERVEACTKCKSYFVCIDLREYAEDPDLQAAPLGLMHLDIVAAQKGFSPLVSTPWNTFS